MPYKGTAGLFVTVGRCLGRSYVRGYDAHVRAITRMRPYVGVATQEAYGVTAGRGASL